MSWTSEAVIIAGYKIPEIVFNEVFKDELPDYVGDYLISTDPVSDTGDYFCGKIIYSVNERSPAMEFDKIYFDKETVDLVNQIFDHWVLPKLSALGFSVPIFTKWLALCWY